MDYLLSRFDSKLKKMDRATLSSLLMYKKIGTLHDEALKEAQTMSKLRYGNFFPITHLVFSVNYKTDVLLHLIVVRLPSLRDRLSYPTRQMGTLSSVRTFASLIDTS